MARERVVDVIVPIVPSSDAGGSGLGVVAAMIAAFLAVVAFAVVACVVVSSADFGPGSVVPSGPGCDPFCPAASTVPGPVGQVAR
ncbi:hypothetical protein ACWIGW_45440 [Nocardia brasiliensis]|uniref:hypothetical protein n=1 Tax=Streptomyces sp. NPDC056056 TaxID=3345698 RepID=UPI0035DD88F6